MTIQDFLWLQENTGFQDQVSNEGRKHLLTCLQASQENPRVFTMLKQVGNSLNVSRGTSNENSS